MEDIELYEPEKQYEMRYKEEHHQNVLDFMQELTDKSEIDPDLNKDTCDKYRNSLVEEGKIQKKLGGQKGLKGFVVALLVIGILAVLIGVILTIQALVGPGVIAIVGGALLFIGMILVLVMVIKPRIKVLNTKLEETKAKSKALLNEAYTQMAPLNQLFDVEDSIKLFTKTLPIIEMDHNFSNERYEELVEQYGYRGVGDVDHSIMGVQSGSILGNPFVIVKEKSKKMVSHTYTGTRVVTWTTTVGSGSNRRTVTHTQTLVAEVVEPRPEYSDSTTLIYGTEAAPKLSFSRVPSNINTMSDKEIEKYVKKHANDLHKLEEKALKKGENYTQLGNEEFELFFGGLDRDNEIEFRLLFTALGQRSMLELLKSKVGYGDDFIMWKQKKITMVSSRHSQMVDLFPNESMFANYDYEACKKNFVEYQDTFFKAVYFDFAPLMCIPLYQQYKASKYIYKDTVKSNMNSVIHEVIANSFKSGFFSHEDTATDTILKTDLANRSGNADILQVTAHSYRQVEHITYVSKLCRNGRYYDVPVRWFEYIPLEKQSIIQSVDLESSKRDLMLSKDNADITNLFMESERNNGMMLSRGLCSVAINSSNINIDISQIKEKMKK